jgi:arginyl-tRNA synthetase
MRKEKQEEKVHVSVAEKINVAVKQTLRKFKFPKVAFEIEHPAEESNGDYATNVALVLKREVKKKPRDLAEEIAGQLKKDKELAKIVADIEVAGSGFINFWLKEEFLVNEAEIINKQKEKYGSSDWGKGKKLVIDYSAPNIAKRFSMGHLRSTIIGQSLYNVYKFLGWKVIGDNHLGDWGTQFGKMIVAIKKWAGKPASELNIAEMEELYVKFHKEAEKNPDLNKEARQAFKNLEDNKGEERKVWQQLIDASMREFQKIYDLLEVEIDVAYGESFYEKIMPDIIKEAKRKKVAVESEGALVIPFPDNNLAPGMLLKSDGATTYFTRDLATVKFRKEKWNPDLVIYEVGVEQSLHFKQVFWAAELIGLGIRSNFVHIPHGHIRLKEGAMSTRKGRTIKLEEVLQKAIKKAKKFNGDDKLAQVVGVGAVKYNDLKKDPRSNYVFD